MPAVQPAGGVFQGACPPTYQEGPAAGARFPVVWGVVGVPVAPSHGGGRVGDRGGPVGKCPSAPQAAVAWAGGRWRSKRSH